MFAKCGGIFALTVMGAWLATSSALASSSQGFPIIGPSVYSTKSSQPAADTVKDMVAPAGAYVLLNWVTNLEDKVQEQIRMQQEGLKEYFPDPKEVSQYVHQLTQDPRVPKGIWKSNEELAKTVEFIASNLLEKIVKRIMLVKQVKDERAELWKNKILSPFLGCTKVAKTYFEADRCLDGLLKFVEPNVGLAILDEKFGESIDARMPKASSAARASYLKVGNQVDALYRSCVTEQVDRVPPPRNLAEACAIRAAKQGIVDLSEAQVTAILADHITNKADLAVAISNVKGKKDGLWDTYRNCIRRLEPKTFDQGFLSCVNDFIAEVGPVVTREIVMNQDAIKEVDSEVERKALANQATSSFKSCIQEQKDRKNFDKDGMLRTDACETQIENGVTYAVVMKSFKKEADDAFGKDSAISKSTFLKGKAQYDSCYKENLLLEERDACLRASIIVFSEALARGRLEQEIGDIFSKKPEKKAELLKPFRQCLSDPETGVPVNASEATDLKPRIDECAFDLTRRAMLFSAEQRLRSAFGGEGQLQAADMEKMIDLQVKKDFAACIDQQKQAKEYDVCIVRLTRESSRHSAQVILPARLKEALGDALKDPTIRSRSENFADAVTKRISGCLDQALPQKADPKANRALQEKGVVLVENCFKDSIRSMASFVADAKFESSTRQMYQANPSRGIEMKAKTVSFLNDCLKSGETPSRRLETFVKDLDVCAERTSNFASLAVGTDQVNLAAAKYLTDKRDAIIVPVLKVYEACLNAIDVNRSETAEDARNTCISQLERSSTEKIVMAVGRGNIRKQMGSDNAIPETDRIETNLHGCISAIPDLKVTSRESASKVVDSCVKQYSVDLASLVGNAKLKLALSRAVGKTDFAAMEPQVQARLSAYEACLNRIRTGNEALEQALSLMDRCTGQLERDGMELTQGRVKSWLGVNSMSEGLPRSARLLFVDSLPCLAAVMPDGNTDPTGAQASSEGVLRDLVDTMRAYMDYDPAKANQDIGKMLKQLSADLMTIEPASARRNFLQLMLDQGVLEQLIKGIVKDETIKAFDSMSASEKRIYEGIRAQILESRNFDEMMATEAGKALIQDTADDLLKPVLLQGKSTSDPELAAAKESIRARVVNQLVDSPKFGDLLISTSVQYELKDLNAVAKVIASIMYGKKALDWSKVRVTEYGKQAEEYIREFVLRPRLQGKTVPDAEMKERMQNAKFMVQYAMGKLR